MNDYDKCVYCGENKWEDREKHIAEVVIFLDEKVAELKEIITNLVTKN